MNWYFPFPGQHSILIQIVKKLLKKNKKFLTQLFTNILQIGTSYYIRYKDINAYHYERLKSLIKLTSSIKYFVIYQRNRYTLKTVQ